MNFRFQISDFKWLLAAVSVLLGSGVLMGADPDPRINGYSLTLKTNGTAVNLTIVGGSATNISVTGASLAGITNLDFTGSRALVSDSAKRLTNSAVTATELGYLTGATGNVQTNLDARLPATNGVAANLTMTGGAINSAAISGGTAADLSLSGTSTFTGQTLWHWVIITASDSPYTISASDVFVAVDCTDGPVTIQMGLADDLGGGGYGSPIYIKKIDSTGNGVTINAAGGEDIDGETSKAIYSQHQGFQGLPHSDGVTAGWWLF
jgi:hypothetical protein